MLTADLRQVIGRAAGRGAVEPGLRPGGAPGCYTSSAAFLLARDGRPPRDVAAQIAAALAREEWIAHAEAPGDGHLVITVTHDALARVAVRVTEAGQACVRGGALRGLAVPAPPATPLAAAADWPGARAILAAELTARLAAAAGATWKSCSERAVVPLPGPGPDSAVAAAIGYAGQDAVRFAVARMAPGDVVPDAAYRECAARNVQAEAIARQVLENSAYAVRYAHAAAAAVSRWAAALGTGQSGFQPRLLAEPGELALLDALSWLPERVAVAARRGRPDEFARYLERLASRTIDIMSTTGFTIVSSISSERLWLAAAARTGLAAGLGLLGVGAPDRI